LGLQRKNEEKELWWAGAEMHHTNKSGKDKDTAMQEIDCDPHNSSSEKENIMKKYISDYSRWDEWVPKDPATLLEQQEETKKKEQGDTEQFEKNNAEFCQQFLDDMKERNKVLEKKKEGADVLRLRGNNAFKKKDYNSALSIYKDSLRSMPYTDKTLLNIAQCYIKLSEFEDAIEFLSRVLYLDDTNAKVESRAFIEILSYLIMMLSRLGTGRLLS
jgi:tetratricopeptide (TPR) repeat protein